MFDPGNETQQELGAGDAVFIRLQPVKVNQDSVNGCVHQRSDARAATYGGEATPGLLLEDATKDRRMVAPA